MKARSASIKLRVFGLLALLVSLVELLLCFAGPLAFIRRPTLILFPPLSFNMSEQEIRQVTAFVEREIARTNSYSVVSQSLLEEYFMKTNPDFDRSRLQPGGYLEARETAERLDLERFAFATVSRYGEQVDLSVYIRYVGDGSIIRSCRISASSFEDLLAGSGENGTAAEMREALSVKTRGITFGNWLVLGLLACQLVLGIMALLGREPGFLAEAVWAPALVLFLFAYIYARNANMDYVQLFIATQGQIKLAQSTALEQLYAGLRFGPLLLINGMYVIWHALENRREERDRNWLYRVFGRWPLPWVVLSAALFALAFPSFVSLEGLGPLAWICLLPLLLVLLATRAGAGIFYGTVFGTLQALIINYWHGTYDYVNLHLITIAFLVQYLLFMIPLVGLLKLSGKWGFLVVPAAWVVFEYCRSVGVLGYPWGLIGASQYGFLPFIQLASITGVWGLSFVIVLGNASLAWVLAAPAFGWSWAGWHRKPGGACLARTVLPLGISIACLAICLGTGGFVLRRLERELYGSPETPVATIVLVQSNRDPRKHEYYENFKRQMSLTDEALAGLPDRPDLVVWPEGGFKLDIRYWTDPERSRSYWARMVEEFLSYQRNLGTWLLTGTQDHRLVVSETGERKRINFNSAILLDPHGGRGPVYHKMHLVPFSEYFPLDKELFSGLYELLQSYNISNWGIGQRRVIFRHDKFHIAAPICFEDAFSDHIRRFVMHGVDVIINLSNDYWSLTPVEGRQHALLALFRAVENRRPLLRSTTSGYTVYIDAAGRIQPGFPEHYTAGYAVARVPLPATRLTLYTHWGDWFPAVCGLALTVFLALKGLSGCVQRLRFEATST
jgi:apolipoprotein N-acyltransferase